MPPKLLNFILFQVGWFACVLPAAAGHPWVGPVLITFWVVGYSVWQREDRSASWVLLSALLLGYLFDSALVLIGIFSFPEQTHLGGPAPIWMAFMWVNLAATLNSCLDWLNGRYFLGALFGFLGGPLAYWGGQELGGMELSNPIWRSLMAIGLEWALAFPVLLWLNAKVRPPNENPEESPILE